MINLSKSGDTIVFEFINNGHYLQNGTIEVPVNSLSLVMDSSNMCTFYKADSNDIFIAATYDELGKTKAEMEAWYEENMVAPQGGGGGGVTSGQVQTMIDDSVSGYADSVLYNSTSKYVEFYHNGTGGTKVYEFDASDFVIDGMVDDVRIETISGVSYLVIDFNTASGKEDIQIPLTDIFNPSDYYTKTEVDQALSGKQDTLSAGTNITITDNVISADVDVKGVEGGRGISVTTGESADTVAFNLPIYQGKGNSSLSLTQPSGTTQYDNKVSGYSTTAIGAGLNVNNQFETALGVHNVDSVDTSGIFGQSGVTLFSIGNGAGSNARHNAIEIKQNGDLYIADTNNTTYTDFYTKPMVKLQDVLDGKQDTLSAGTNITISGNVISAEGGGKAIEAGRGISITTGETADTVSFDLPISAATNGSILIGTGCSANGYKSFVGGQGSVGQSEGSFAFGQICKAGQWSIAVGNCVEANIAPNSAAFGKYNKQNGGFYEADSATTLFSVGNGTASNARHNAFEIRRNGDIYLTKDGQDVKLQDQLGGGGSSYTAGDGIDITNDVISVTGKVDTSTYTAYTAATEAVLSGKTSVVNLTQAEYDALVTGGTVDPTVLYNITDATAVDISQYWTSAQTNSAITEAVSGKQDTLVSGTNIKTINNESILGSGNIDIQGGGGGKAVSGGTNISITTGETADTINCTLPITVGGSFNGSINLSAKRTDNVMEGDIQVVQGAGTKATNNREMSIGAFNVSNKANTTWGDSGNTLFSVGNGTANNARHNAFEIRQNGDIYITKNGQDVKLQDQLGGGGGSSYSAGDGIDITNNVISVTGVVMSSAVTSAVTSGSTDVVTSGGVYNQLGGLKLVKLTQSAYDALSPNYDNNTLYVVVN